MTRFTSLDLLEQMSPVGLTAHVLMNVSGGSVPPQTNGEIIKAVAQEITYCRVVEDEEVDEEKRREEEQHKFSLIQFWQNLGQCVQASKDGHMLRDVAQIEVKLTQPLVPDNSEEKVRVHELLIHVKSSQNGLTHYNFSLHPQESYGQTLFNDVAHSVYQVLIQSTQYQHYVRYLNLRPLSLPGPLCGAKGSSFVTDAMSLSPLTAQR